MNSTLLSNKEKKNVLKVIKEQFGIKNLDLDYLFFKNNDNKIFLVSKEFSNINSSKFRINNIGLYFARIEPWGIRLSIEGSQLIGKKATKNVLETENYEDWMKGQDILTDKKFKGFVIIKNKDNYFGSGSFNKGKITNFVPKSRRIRI